MKIVFGITGVDVKPITDLTEASILQPMHIELDATLFRRELLAIDKFDLVRPSITDPEAAKALALQDQLDEQLEAAFLAARLFARKTLREWARK